MPGAPSLSVPSLDRKGGMRFTLGVFRCPLFSYPIHRYPLYQLSAVPASLSFAARFTNYSC